MTKTIMPTRTQLLMAALGALSTGASGPLACGKGERQGTEVPAAASGPRSSDDEGECLHSEGCCGGHKEGDASCGGERAAADGADGAEEDGARATIVGPQRFAWTVEPGKAVEINVELAAGAQMSARFEAGGSLVWNVHSHPDGRPKIHAEGDAATGSPAFVAREAGVYSYLWVNKGERAIEITVELHLEGGGRVHSTYPTAGATPSV